MSRWFRHYAGMMRDEKMVRAAMASKQPVHLVLWIWGAILESAAEVNDGGRFELDAAEVGYFLRIDESDVAAVMGALEGLGRVRQGAVVHWGDRQFNSDKTGHSTRAITTDGSYVYVVGTTWDTAVKIGFSKNPWARLVEFQTGSASKLEVLATFKADTNSEVDIHQVLKEFRQHGEWFALPDPIRDVLKSAPKGTLYVDIVALLRSSVEQLRSEQLRSNYATTTESESESESKMGEIRAREAKSANVQPLVRPEAHTITAQCLQAIGFAIADAPPQWSGLTYQIEMLLSRGIPPPVIVGKFAELREHSGKAMKYFIRAIENAYAEKPRMINGSKQSHANKSAVAGFDRLRVALAAHGLCGEAGETAPVLLPPRRLR